MKSRTPPFLTGSLTQRFACRGWTAGRDRPSAPHRAKRFDSRRCCACATQAASAPAVRQQSIERHCKRASVGNIARDQPDPTRPAAGHAVFASRSLQEPASSAGCPCDLLPVASANVRARGSVTRGGLHLRFSGSGGGRWSIAAPTSSNTRSSVTWGPTAAHSDPLPIPSEAVAADVHL
jgi:hypothetical protein